MGKILSGNYEQDVCEFKNIFRNCFDVANKELYTLGGKRVFVAFIDGLVSKDMVNDSIVRPLMEVVFRVDHERRSIDTIRDIQTKILTMCDTTLKSDLEEIANSCLSGDTIIIVDGETQAMVSQTRSWINRGVQEPQTQKTVRGPREGFTETLLFNTSMLRRKLKTSDLKMDIISVGDVSKTNICVAYVDGIAKKETVALVKQKLNDIDVSYVLESGHIEQLIDENPHSLFATIGNNEKPDIVAAKLLKGKVAILCDGTPFVLTVPMVFMENFQAAEDYYARPYYTNFIRFIRIFSYIITLFLPALYVALTTHHPEMIPDKLLITLLRAREGVPFSAAFEMILMLILYELLREAILRLPEPLGAAVSIGGVLIIGESAVAAGIIGGPVIVVAAMTFITGAVVNPMIDSVAITRILILILGMSFGMFGILAGTLVLIAHLCSLSSFGMPYMFPVAPSSKDGIKKTVLRTDIRKILKVREK